MSKLINTNYLTTLEEFDAIMRFHNPHLLSLQDDVFTKKKMALLVAEKKEDEILLISPDGFLNAMVIAGITEKNIEYIAKHAPQEYKKNIIDAVKEQKTITEAMEIAKSIDKELGQDTNINQERLNNVIQYIKDNITIFEF